MSKDLLQVFIEDLQKILTDKKLTSKIKVTGDEEIDLLIKQTQLLLTDVQKCDDRIALQKKSLKAQLEIHTSDLEETIKKLNLYKRQAIKASLSQELRTPINHDRLQRNIAGENAR